jgi:hypothetical protein
MTKFTGSTLRVIGIYLLMLAVNTGLLVWLTSGPIQERFNQDAIGYARLTTPSVAAAFDSYFNSGYNKFLELVRNAMSPRDDLNRLFVIDVEGRILFDSAHPGDGAPVVTERITDSELLLAVKALELHCRLVRAPDRSTYLDIIVPHIDEWGRHRISVRYQIAYTSWGDPLISLRQRFLIAALISFFLGVLLLVLFAGRNGRPESTPEARG